jgi:hypothetical protein
MAQIALKYAPLREVVTATAAQWTDGMNASRMIEVIAS